LHKQILWHLNHTCTAAILTTVWPNANRWYWSIRNLLSVDSLSRKETTVFLIDKSQLMRFHWSNLIRYFFTAYFKGTLSTWTECYGAVSKTITDAPDRLGASISWTHFPKLVLFICPW
jgi:hypothetical protein